MYVSTQHGVLTTACDLKAVCIIGPVMLFTSIPDAHYVFRCNNTADRCILSKLHRNQGLHGTPVYSVSLYQ